MHGLRKSLLSLRAAKSQRVQITSNIVPSRYRVYRNQRTRFYESEEELEEEQREIRYGKKAARRAHLFVYIASEEIYWDLMFLKGPPKKNLQSARIESEKKEWKRRQTEESQ